MQAQVTLARNGPYFNAFYGDVCELTEVSVAITMNLICLCHYEKKYYNNGHNFMFLGRFSFGKYNVYVIESGVSFLHKLIFLWRFHGGAERPGEATFPFLLRLVHKIIH